MDSRELKNRIITDVEAAFGRIFSKKLDKLELDLPPSVELGDFAVAFFSEAKKLKMSPDEIVRKMEQFFPEDEIVEKVKAAGPYLNIKIKNEKLFGSVLGEIGKEKGRFGNSDQGEGKKVMIEYLSPNTNKPLHLGHVRNGTLGMALANILQAAGSNVTKAILINDRGVHICKSMLAFLKWGKDETPQSTGIKGDHFVGRWYVRYSEEAEKDPELKDEVQKLLKDWETGDKEVLALWKKMNKWAYQGFSETYQKFGFKFDEFFYESDTYKSGKDVVEKGLDKKVFRKNKEGATIFDLPEDEFGLDRNGQPRKMTVLREDGTSVYLTQDLGTAVAREDKFKLDRLIYVVGSEQIFYFKVLFRILQDLGYSWAKDLYHMPHAMVYLPEGKMKSRQGKVVDADNLAVEVETLVAAGVKERNPELEDAEIKRRSEIIALGAIKFYLLRVRPEQDIHFDPDESVTLDGFTGPYCQYAYARIQGILRNSSGTSDSGKADFSSLGNFDELELVQKLIQFPDEVQKAARELNPLRVATAVYETAKAFNLFYNNNQVLDDKDAALTAARLELVKATAEVLKKGLALLGIEVLERM